MEENSHVHKHISAAFLFIIIMAIVSMFSDMVHEGANSIIGAFESLVGASPLAISIVSGLGMLIGYTLRILTGYIADKTKHYWALTIVGYVLDLVMIPLLALVPENGWLLACAFIIMEKVGKAIKKPAKNALVSFAAKENGTGKSFALSELLDQLGAFIGPIILFITYLFASSMSDYNKYRLGFLVLGIPALICIVLLIVAFKKYPHPETFEKEESSDKPKKMSKIFILFLLGSAFMAFGFVDFPLFTAHIAKTNLFSSEYLPLLYSYAMLMDALSALVFGLIYDKKGIGTIVVATLISASATFFLLYFNDYWAIFLGAGLWGIGMGAQESVMLSVITDLTNKPNRAKAFAAFDTVFGIFWFLGSLVSGILYSTSILWLSIFSMAFIFMGGIVFLILSIVKKKEKTKEVTN